MAPTDFIVRYVEPYGLSDMVIWNVLKVCFGPVKINQPVKKLDLCSKKAVFLCIDSLAEVRGISHGKTGSDLSIVVAKSAKLEIDRSA